MRIAVIGAGPAGSRAAARLAGAGHSVTLFDSSFDREKPCGGGVTSSALRLLFGAAGGAGGDTDSDQAHLGVGRDANVRPRRDTDAAKRREARGGNRPVPHKDGWSLPGALIRRVVFEGPSGNSASVELERPLGIFSRRTLDAALVREAEARGTSLVRERVVSIERRERGIALGLSGGGTALADHVVGADGARSLVRRVFSSPFDRGCLTQAVGWYIPGRTSDTATIRFDPRIPGYLWIFPRPDHLAVGACAPLATGVPELLWATARDLLESAGMRESEAELYSALIPSLTPAALDAIQVSGTGWSLVGDASGCVDPLTREGIGPAIRSADLLAEAFARGEPASYGALWRRAFFAELSWAAARRTRFFDPALTDRLVRYLGRSRAIRTVMADLIAGTQDYRSLKRRLLRSSLAAGAQLALSKAVSRSRPISSKGADRVAAP